MKNKEKKLINLSMLYQKLDQIKCKPDYKLEFELAHFIFIIANLVNINISLYSTSYFNYNYSLLIFNIFFLSRKFLQTLYFHYSTRYQILSSSFSGYILIVTYSIIIVYCLVGLFIQYSFNILLNLICPFIAYQFLIYSAMSSRYSDGSIDCFYSLQQISLNSLEILYCSGYLPYKFFPNSSFFFNTPVFLNTLLVMFLCDSIFHFGEFIRKRAAELIFFTQNQGEWKKTIEIATEEWNAEKVYEKGEVVKHKGDCWKSTGRENRCEPGKYEIMIFMLLFRNPISTLKKVNIVTAISAGVHNIYLIYLPFHYSQVLSVLIFSFVLFRNIKICKHLTLPNV